MSGSEPAWATAIIEPNRDFEAEIRLRHDGFRVVLLAYRKRLTGHTRPGWRAKCEFVPRPLFPGYLFVELEPDQAWPKRNGCGFVGFVMAERKPLTLPHHAVWAWKALMQTGAYDDHAPEALQPHKFQPANDPDERRRLLGEAFKKELKAAGLVDEHDEVA